LSKGGGNSARGEQGAFGPETDSCGGLTLHQRGWNLDERSRDFEGMVKRWKRNSQTVVAEFKRRRFYQPPSEQRRLAKAKAEKRARRAQMKRERLERRNG
jgi:ribosomal protein S21